MNVLTLYEPWASFVVYGIKRRETRSWKTSYRGALLIHASKSLPGDVLDTFRYSEPQRAIFAASGLTWERAQRNRGRILGAVWLDRAQSTRYDLEIDPRERLLGNYSGERFVWFLEQPHEFASQPRVRGQRRIWNFPEIDWPAEWKDEPFLEALEQMKRRAIA